MNTNMLPSIGHRSLEKNNKQKRLPSYSMNTNMLPLIGQSTKLLDAMLATTLACLGCTASKSLLVLDKSYKCRLVSVIGVLPQTWVQSWRENYTEATSKLFIYVNRLLLIG